MIDKESVEQDKEVDNDWVIPEWFSSDKKGGGEIDYMVNTLCTKEGDIKTSGFRESNFNQIVVVNYQINLLLRKGPIEVISYKSDL